MPVSSPPENPSHHFSGFFRTLDRLSTITGITQSVAACSSCVSTQFTELHRMDPGASRSWRSVAHPLPIVRRTSGNTVAERERAEPTPEASIRAGLDFAG
jgi:hypothetical protein